MKKLLLMFGIVAALMTGCKKSVSAVEGEWKILYFEVFPKNSYKKSLPY